MNVKVIAATNLKKEFMQGATQLAVLQGISVEFEQGKTYAITGVSGTGKSTLLHLLAGLDKPTAGAVLYDNKNIADFTAQQQSLVLNKTIGLVFQLPYLLRELSVIENVMMPGLIGGRTAEECRARALTLLKQVGLSEKAEVAPTTLSGGQQQRVAIARALFNEPDFLLADEPTGNLDIKTGKEIVDVLLNCQKQQNMGIIISSHDPYVAQQMDTVFELQQGQLRVL